MAQPLHNYLRTYRKHAGLSQSEVAFLLGCRDGSRVCRHERFRRRPSLEVAMAYEALFQVSVRELFAGLYRKVASDTALRAKALTQELALRGSNRLVSRKLVALRAATEPTAATSRSHAGRE